MRIQFALTAVLILVSPLAAQFPTDPTPQNILARAQAALDQDRPADALVLLGPMVAIDPSIKGLQHELGLVYYRTGKLAEAQAAFAAAIKQDPSDQESVQLEGLVLYRLGRPAEAIPYLEQVRQWLPGANTDATYVLGLCYLNAQRYEDARASFAAQFGLKPDSGGAYLLLAKMLKRANLTEPAASQAQKALALDPNLPLAHFMLGEIALAQSNTDQAIVELEAERRINPGYAPLYDRLGDAYLHQDKLEQAQQALIKSIALDTSITSSFTRMGEVLMRRHDLRTALLYLKHAETMDPDDAVIHTLLSQAYHRTGQDDDAKRENDLASKIHAGKALNLDPGK